MDIHEPTSVPTGTRLLSRRTIAKGAAWSLPVIAVGSTVPAFAASGCQSEKIIVDPNSGTNSAVYDANGVRIGQQFFLNAKDSKGQTTYYRITAVTAGTSDTVFMNPSGQGPQTTQMSYNMMLGNSGINGAPANDGSNDRIFTGFGPGGNTLVMNQRGRQSGSGQSPSYASPSQTMTLTFENSSTSSGPWSSFKPGTAAIKVFDISSVDDALRDSYWDGVSFSVPATGVVSTGLSVGSPLAGSGTASDPYRRQSGRAATQGNGSYFTDEFQFNNGFPSGSTLTYSSYNSRGGWQFISILTVSFTVDTICPPGR
ncbi:hypothetical protein V3G39_06350 [Dermatophilaceae bacterium Sec6.4]